MAVKKQFKKIFKKGSKTYFTSSLFFSSAVKKEVFTLYAFVRTADDFVDAVPQDKKGFNSFCAQYKKSLSGHASGDPIIDSFVSLLHRKEFDPAWVDSFLSAMRADLSKSTYDSLDETEHYMHGSAEVIGLFMCRILGIPERAWDAAKLQGRAMQYINFIRDIQEDLDLGRQYIPSRELSRFGLTGLSELEARTHPAAFRKCIRKQILLYKSWQRAAKRGYKYIPYRARIAIKTAADMYEWTAQKIWKDPFVVYARKVKPSKIRILLCALYNTIILINYPRVGK